MTKYFTISIVCLYVIAIVICWVREQKQNRIRQIEEDARRRRQQREWREQFNLLSPTVRASIRMLREDRREVAAVIALLCFYHNKKDSKDKVDWKKEGF